MSDTFDFALARELAIAVTTQQGVQVAQALPSFEEAKHAAGEELFSITQEWMDVLMNTEGYEPRIGWTDFREHMVAREIRGPTYESFFQREPLLIDSVFSELRPILAISEEATEVMDDVIADIYHCVLSRHIHGHASSFWERVLCIYRDGYWPCGWRGSFPEIEFVVYRFKK